MNRDSEKFYDRLSFLYPIIDLFLTPQKLKFFSTINSFPTGRLLEIGIGNGANLNYYNTHDITGVDTSKNMLARARKHQKSNMKLFHMNGQTLSFPNESFDYVILSHVITVVEDPEKLLEEVYRVLKPNGKVFILNHVTPGNWLRFVDKFFESISGLFYFKSVFHISGLRKLEKFTLQSEFNAGLFSYFKILIYEKSL